MFGDDAFTVIHATIAYTLTEFLLKILCSGLDAGKCLSIRFRKFLPTFVLTFLLKGGLNQIIFLVLVLFLWLLLGE